MNHEEAIFNEKNFEQIILALYARLGNLKITHSVLTGFYSI